MGSERLSRFFIAKSLTVVLVLLGFQPAVATESFELSPLLGEGFSVTVGSEFALSVERSPGFFTSSSELSVLVTDTSQGLKEKYSGAKLIAENNIWGTSSGTSTRLLTSVAGAKTNHPGGLLRSDVTFTKAASPYKFARGVEIAAGVVVTVEPGAVLDFSEAGFGFWVHGSLVAGGTETERITIAAPSLNFEQEGFFKFQGASSSIVNLSNTDLYGSGSGSLLDSGWSQGSSLLISKSRVSGFSRGVWSSSLSNLVIQDSALIGLGEIGGYFWGHNLRIERNLFDNQMRSGQAFRIYSFNPESNTIAFNSFENYQETVVTTYVDVDLRNNFWGSQSTLSAQDLVLDENDSLAYPGEALLEPILESSESFFSESHTVPVSDRFMYANERTSPTLILSPKSNLEDSFSVQVQVFEDLNGNGLPDSTERQSSVAIVNFLSALDLGAMVAIDQVWRGSQTLRASIEFPEAVNSSFIDSSDFSLEFVHSSQVFNGVAASLWWSPFNFRQEVGQIEVGAITARAFFRGDFLAESPPTFLNHQNVASIQIEGPNQIRQGNSATFNVTFLDTDGWGRAITAENSDPIIVSYQGAGLFLGESSRYTNEDGILGLFLITGGNDVGTADLTVSYGGITVVKTLEIGNFTPGSEKQNTIMIRGQDFSTGNTTALAGATISITGGGLSWSAKTDVNGLAIFLSIPSGSYTLEVWAPAQGLVYRNLTRTIEISDESDVRSFTLFAGESGSYSLGGQVLDQDSNPVAEALVIIQSEAGPNYLITDETGHFSKSSLPQGDYWVSVEKEGFFNSRAVFVYLDSNLGISLELFSVSTNRILGKISSAGDGTNLANVELQYWSNAAGGFSGGTTSDEDGNYVIYGVPSGSAGEPISLSVREFPRDLRYFGEFLNTTFDAADTVRNLVLTPLPNDGGRLSGTVFTRVNRQPVPFAEVSLGGIYVLDNGAIKYAVIKTTADEFGEYELDGLAFDVGFELSVNILNEETGAFLSGQKAVSIYSSSPSRTVDVLLETPMEPGLGSISGQILDESGLPIPGARVYASLQNPEISQFSELFSASTVSLQDGTYLLENLPGGDYVIVVDSEEVDFLGRQIFRPNWSDPAFVRLGSSFDQLTNQDVILARHQFGTSRIQGRVVDSATGAGIPNVQLTVDALSQDLPNQSVSTNSTGFYEFLGLAAGNYRVSLWQSDTFQVPDPVQVFVSDGATRQLSNLRVRVVSEGSSSLRVLVRDSRTHLPLAGGSVSAHLENSSLFKRAEIDNSGFAQFSGLPEGRYKLYASDDKAISFPAVGQNRTVTVGPGETKFSVSVLNLTTDGQLEGFVLDEFGDPVVNASVHLSYSYSISCCEGDGFGMSGSTDDSGFFRVSGVPSDIELDLFVAPEYYYQAGSLLSPIRGKFFISSDTPRVTQNFVLPEEAQISGRLVLNGRGFTNGTIEAEDLVTGEIVATTSSNNNGEWILRGLKAGSYRVLVTMPNWSESKVQLASGYLRRVQLTSAVLAPLRTEATVVTVGSGATTRIPEVALEVGSQISGTLLLNSGSQSIGGFSKSARIVVYRDSGASGFQPFTVIKNAIAHGFMAPNFRILGLPAGSYKLQFVDEWKTGGEFDSVFHDGSANLSDAEPIILDSAASIEIDPVVLQLRAPSQSPPTVSLTSMSQQEREMKKDVISVSREGNLVRLLIGGEFAGTFVSVSKTGSIQSQSFAAQFASSWSLVDDSGAITVSGNGDVVVTDPFGVVIGWTTITNASIPTTPGTVGGGGGGGAAPLPAPIQLQPGFVSGSYQVGQTLTANVGLWENQATTTFTYQWHRCRAELVDPSAADVTLGCSAIFGATGREYSVVEADSGLHILVEIKAKDSTGVLLGETIKFSNTLKFGETGKASTNSVVARDDGAMKTWAKRMIGNTEAKLYAKNIVGAGKVSLRLNGREIAWANARTASDRKLRVINEGPMSGTNYLVRTIKLQKGKNVLEVFVDGKRTTRVSYSRK